MKKYETEDLEKSPEFLRVKNWLEKNEVEYELGVYPGYTENEDDTKFLKFFINDEEQIIQFLPNFNREHKKYFWTIFQTRSYNSTFGWHALNYTWPATITKTIKELNIKIKKGQ